MLASLGRRWFLDVENDDSAVCLPQIILRRLLDQRGSYLFEVRFDLIYVLGFIVEQCKGGEQVRASDASELRHRVVQSGAELNECTVYCCLIDGFLLHPGDHRVTRRKDLLRCELLVVNQI